MLAALFFAACQTATPPMPTTAKLSHDVYFALKDSSPEASQKLVGECYSKLAAIDGVVFLAAGTRDAELTRDVNDLNYHVSLHVFFRDRAAHDIYQDAPAHLQFIEANKDNWTGVRVFDSNLGQQ
ncbi:MAG: hypothetical protein ACI9SE_004533 [Neolewinella sp.]|jgi:hypothetical protein